MAFKADKIWFDGKLVDWDKAQIHVLSHAVHYGSAAFEGIRLYDLPTGPAVFRLGDHLKRLLDSCKIYRIEVSYDLAALTAATLETLRANRFRQAYIRPIIFRGFGELGVNGLRCPTNTVIAAWDWGSYLGEGALEDGVSVCVSSWNRPAPNTMPSMAKVAANYMNSQLVKMEAIQNGYHEGIVLDTEGFVAEGSGENVFLVKNGVLFTPPSYASLLPGITRHSVMRLAEAAGLRVESHRIPREALYVADEIFMTGTAAEITPVTKVDQVTVGAGRRGPVTEKLQKAFFDLVRGRTPDEYRWLTPL